VARSSRGGDDGAEQPHCRACREEDEDGPRHDDTTEFADSKTDDYEYIQPTNPIDWNHANFECGQFFPAAS